MLADSMRQVARALTVVILLISKVLFAEPYTETSVMAPFSMEDQHGGTRSVDKSTPALLFSRDMDGGSVIREALGKDGAELLKRSGTVYVSDVSGMPWLILKMIAKPKMRDRPYPIMLDEDGDLTESIPSVDGHATLILLDDLKVVRITTMDSPEDLRKALELLPKSAVTP